MIKIPIHYGNGYLEPSRPLTPEENQRALIGWVFEDNYVYFEQGDENTPEYKAYLIASEGQDPLPPEGMIE
jgi:hypothetical protein